MWVVGVVALVVAAVAATPAGAAGNSDNAKLCQKGGWKTLFRSDGSTFADQGACVSYGAKGGTILTGPPNAWKAGCEQAGGTFSVSHADVFGNALTPPAFAYTCTPVSFDTWLNVLDPICSGYPDFGGATWILDNGTVGDCVRNGTT